MALDAYLIEFESVEDLVKDYMAEASLFGRPSVITLYRYSDMVFSMRLFSGGVGFHFFKDPSGEFKPGEYIYDLLANKIRQRDRKDLGANELLILIIQQRTNTLLSRVKDQA